MSQIFAAGNDTRTFLLSRFVCAEKYTRKNSEVAKKHSVNLSTAVEIMQSFLNSTAYSHINECSPWGDKGGGNALINNTRPMNQRGFGDSFKTNLPI